MVIPRPPLTVYSREYQVSFAAGFPAAQYPDRFNYFFFDFFFCFIDLLFFLLLHPRNRVYFAVAH